MDPSFTFPILIILSFMITPLPAEVQASAAPAPTIASATHLSASCKLDAAQVTFKDGQLNVTTGVITRTWSWTRKGLVTTAINNTQTDQAYAKPTPDYPSDWSLPGLIEDETDAELISVTAHLSDDEGFSSQHIEVVSTIRYQTQKLEIQHVVWIFPGAPGLRTQLRIKGLDGFSLGKARSIDQDQRHGDGVNPEKLEWGPQRHGDGVNPEKLENNTVQKSIILLRCRRYEKSKASITVGGGGICPISLH